MQRNIVETALGGLVLVVALTFVIFSYNKADVAKVDGYRVKANFATVGGLKEGDEVQVGGVKVGSVVDITLDPVTYFGQVHMTIDPDIQLPLDTTAIISSESLLGGRFMSLEPGAEEEYIEDEGVIQYTQAPQNLEQLLGKFIFSMQDGGNAGGDGDAPM